MRDTCPACGDLTSEWVVFDSRGNMCCPRCYDVALAALQQLAEKPDPTVRPATLKTSKQRKGKGKTT